MDSKDSPIHTRLGAKTPRRNSPTQFEGEPRRGLRRHHRGTANTCPFPGNLPLGEHDGVLPPAVIEEPSKNRRCQIERYVANDYRCVERISESVSLFHHNLRQRTPQLLCSMFIELQSGHLTS